MVLGVAAVGLLEDYVCGNVVNMEISWPAYLPISSSDWYDRHKGLPKLGAVTQSYSWFSFLNGNMSCASISFKSLICFLILQHMTVKRLS